MLPAMEKAKVISSEDLARLKEKLLLPPLQKITEQSGGQAVLMCKWNDADKRFAAVNPPPWSISKNCWSSPGMMKQWQLLSVFLKAGGVTSWYCWPVI